MHTYQFSAVARVISSNIKADKTIDESALSDRTSVITSFIPIPAKNATVINVYWNARGASSLSKELNENYNFFVFQCKRASSTNNTWGKDGASFLDPKCCHSGVNRACAKVHLKIRSYQGYLKTRPLQNLDAYCTPWSHLSPVGDP